MLYLLTLLYRPVAVAPLLIETEEERALFQKGENNYKAKKELRKESLLERTPNDEESDLIHAMWTSEMSYKSMKISTPSLLSMVANHVCRPQYPPNQAFKPHIHVRHCSQNCPDHATPISQPPQLHDLRRLPPQTDLRISILLRRLFLPLKTYLRLPRSEHIRQPRPRRKRPLPESRGLVHRPTTKL